MTVIDLGASGSVAPSGRPKVGNALAARTLGAQTFSGGCVDGWGRVAWALVVDDDLPVLQNGVGEVGSVVLTPDHIGSGVELFADRFDVGPVEEDGPVGDLPLAVAPFQ